MEPATAGSISLSTQNFSKFTCNENEKSAQHMGPNFK